MVLLLVAIPGAKDVVDDVSVVGQKDQPLAHLVQPTHGVNACGKIDGIDDVVFLTLLVCGADDAHGLVVRNDDAFLVVAGHRLAIHLHHVSR